MENKQIEVLFQGDVLFWISSARTCEKCGRKAYITERYFYDKEIKDYRIIFGSSICDKCFINELEILKKTKDILFGK